MAKKPKPKTPARRKSPTRLARPKRPVRQQPESLRLRELLPGLTVNDIHASVAFYRDVLGFVVAEEWTHEGKLAGATMRAGVIEFLLSQDDFAKGRDRKKGEGFRLYCTTAQDVDHLAATLKTKGATLLQDPRDQPWGTRDFAVADPDGFRISIANERI